MGPVQRLLIKGVLRVVEHPIRTLVIAGVALVVCAAGAKRYLTVSSDQNKLFSPKVKFFADWLEFDRKFPENQAIYVIIEPANPSARLPVGDWTTLADHIYDRLLGMPEQVANVIDRTDITTPGAPGILFADPKELPSAFDGIKDISQLASVLGEKPSGATQLLLGRLPLERYLAGMSAAPPEDRARGMRLLHSVASDALDAVEHPDRPLKIPNIVEANAETPAELGYFYVPDQDPADPKHDLLLIRVYEQENRSGLTTEADTIDAIRKAVEAEAAPFPQFKVGLTGRPVLDADQDKVTDRDGTRAEILALSVVFLGLVIFLRSIWLAIVAEVSLAVAIGWTYGWATISVGQLNLLSTVFLIALIGIGMDYLIQILAAYRREARRYVRPDAIWARVFRYVGPPVNTACLGAAGAFLVSALTDFKGAAELGIIAGGGLLLCLLSAYTVLPAILVLRPPPRLKARHASQRYGHAPPRTARRLLMPVIWMVLLLAGIHFMKQAEFNPNLLDLQAPNLPSVKLVRKLQTWEAVVLSPDLQMLRKVKDAVEASPQVAGSDSILRAIDNQKWLENHASELPKINWTTPPDVEPDDFASIAGRARALADKIAPESSPPADANALDTAQKLRALAEILSHPSDKAAEIAGSLTAWQNGFVEELKKLITTATPPPVQIDRIPPAVREHLVSTVEATPQQPMTYALYIEPKNDLWNREALSAFMVDVEARVASVPGAPDVTGIASDIYHSTESIQKAFYHATAYALALIFILVLIDLRSIYQTLIAVSVLALGLPMLVALMGLMHASWNFANFFGLPILIGAGHEYGVFLMHRYREAVHDPRRVWRRWDPSDRALLLCAFVTTSSFGFFWLMSSHLGLKSLGLVMAVGTLCIYLSAILVVRPLLTWKLEARRPKRTPSASNGRSAH